VKDLPIFGYKFYHYKSSTHSCLSLDGLLCFTLGRICILS